jgi:uncharacterized protein
MKEIVKHAEAFVRQFLEANLPPDRYFHNIDHAKDVVYAVNEIGTMCTLEKEDLIVLEVAAWFHDTGYCFTYRGHEISSIEIAEKFLGDELCNKAFITKVLNCIWSTRFPQEPESLLEQIICDADLFHFSKENYADYAHKLRNEWEAVLNKSFSDHDWNLMNMKLLITHRFHTIYGKQVLEDKKQKNIMKLRSAAFPSNIS